MSGNVLFVFGLGYSARALAADLMAQGWTVRGTTRSAEKQAELARQGIETAIFDGETPLADRAVLEDVTHLLASVPPGPDGDRSCAITGTIWRTALRT